MENVDNKYGNNSHDNATQIKPSWGGFIHKWGSYLSVDWLFNAASGVSFSYWGKYSEFGKKHWSGPITKAFTKMLAPLIKDPHNLKASAAYGNAFVSLIAGGMFTIPPLMILENKCVKKSIAQYLDGFIYGKDKVENDPDLLAAYKAIDEEPKKDFLTGMVARFAALAPLLAIILTPSAKQVGNKLLFNHVENLSDKVARNLGFSEKSFKKVSATEAQERWKFIHENVSMDFGLGIPYAVMHAFFYNMFAKCFHGKKENKEIVANNKSPDLENHHHYSQVSGSEEKAAKEGNGNLHQNRENKRRNEVTPESALAFA